MTYDPCKYTVTGRFRFGRDPQTLRKAIPFNAISRQHLAARVGLAAVEKALIEMGAIRVQDSFDLSGIDYAEVEKRVMAAMSEADSVIVDTFKSVTDE